MGKYSMTSHMGCDVTPSSFTMLGCSRLAMMKASWRNSLAFSMKSPPAFNFSCFTTTVRTLLSGPVNCAFMTEAKPPLPISDPTSMWLGSIRSRSVSEMSDASSEMGTACVSSILPLQYTTLLPSTCAWKHSCTLKWCGLRLLWNTRFLKQNTHGTLRSTASRMEVKYPSMSSSTTCTMSLIMVSLGTLPPASDASTTCRFSRTVISSRWLKLSNTMRPTRRSPNMRTSVPCFQGLCTTMLGMWQSRPSSTKKKLRGRKRNL
mmetsp:Transcript_5584/g.14119  ORF Transcript_5584/g.14119 Transcript_5584/m.14119 type:complete len:262 (+) Transcript_5584:1026-1811(+)